MNFQRVWAMPTADTFDCEPIKGFVQKYLLKSKVSVDPFARNKRWATYTNDLDHHTAAEFHHDARDFCDALIAQGIKCDLAICDPPYSQVQVARAYNGVGKEYKPFGDDNNAVLYRQIRDKLDRLIEPEGIVLSFGWSSSGMGKERGFELIEILLVCHGAAHNDTICIAERRIPKRQMELA